MMVLTRDDLTVVVHVGLDRQFVTLVTNLATLVLNA